MEIEGQSGADIENLVNESSYIALRRGLDYIDDSSILKALK